MVTISTLFNQHRLWTEVTFVAVLISFLTYAMVKLAVPPSPWHTTWMIFLPIAIGAALNRGIMRVVMAFVQLFVALIATTVTGNALGGF